MPPCEQSIAVQRSNPENTIRRIGKPYKADRTRSPLLKRTATLPEHVIVSS